MAGVPPGFWDLDDYNYMQDWVDEIDSIQPNRTTNEIRRGIRNLDHVLGNLLVPIQNDSDFGDGLDDDFEDPQPYVSSSLGASALSAAAAASHFAPPPPSASAPAPTPSIPAPSSAIKSKPKAKSKKSKETAPGSEIAPVVYDINNPRVRPFSSSFHFSP
jgi:hypothetical protein